MTSSKPARSTGKGKAPGGGLGCEVTWLASPCRGRRARRVVSLIADQDLESIFRDEASPWAGARSHTGPLPEGWRGLVGRLAPALPACRRPNCSPCGTSTRRLQRPSTQRRAEARGSAAHDDHVMRSAVAAGLDNHNCTQRARRTQTGLDRSDVGEEVDAGDITIKG